MRDKMPQTARFIDSLREAFGKESIDSQIRRGLQGDPVFYAKEGDHELGTPILGASDQPDQGR